MKQEKQMNIRLLMLPVKKINNALPKKGIIYDIGCGKGDLSFAIAQKELKRKIIGIDMDKQKTEKTKKYKSKSNLSIIYGDALKFRYKFCNGVILSDFLHHIPYDDQEKLLKELVAKMQKDAVLIIKEIDKDDFIRHWLSRLWDFLLYPMDKIYYRAKTEWINLLQANSFSVVATSETLWFPGSTTLFICKKK